MRKKIVAGNWKMNLSFEEGKQLTEEVVSRISNVSQEIEIILFPSFIHLAAIHRLTDGYRIKIGSQNNHHQNEGAYTGEISSSMLKSVGVKYGLVGHSERRIYFKESDDDLLAKSKALIQSGIHVIFCCGESLESRKKEDHFNHVKRQLAPLWTLNEREFAQISIAYEPVWAIGTGETASADQAQEMHAFIRQQVKVAFSETVSEETSIIYGGSVNPSNASSLFAMDDVDGGLIGGASLKVDSFLEIAKNLN